MIQRFTSRLGLGEEYYIARLATFMPLHLVLVTIFLLLFYHYMLSINQSINLMSLSRYPFNSQGILSFHISSSPVSSSSYVHNICSDISLIVCRRADTRDMLWLGCEYLYISTGSLHNLIYPICLSLSIVYSSLLRYNSFQSLSHYFVHFTTKHLSIAYGSTYDIYINPNAPLVNCRMCTSFQA